MAGTAVATPTQALSQPSLHTTSPDVPDTSSSPVANKPPTVAAVPPIPQTDSIKLGAPHATASQSFHRSSYQFRPRFPPNKGAGQDDATLGLQYDGKRMRKAIHRKTVDYNPSSLNYIRNRVWQRDKRDYHQIQPDSLYAVDLVPPQALLEHPMNCVTTRFVRTSTNKHRCPIFCVTWTPEGRRLVTGASSGEFTLWNGLTFNFETILQAHETAVRAMRWSHADAWMVTADHAGYIKYWQSNMNNVKMFQAHKEPVRGISFCPSDTKFASCSDDGTVRVWDFMRCQEERILRGHGADVRCVDWHPQKALIASGSKDNQQPVKLWDPRTGHGIATLHAHKHTVMDLKWNQNGNWLLTASRDHLLKLFDVRNLKEEVQTFKGHKREATAIGWHPIHEGLFVSGSADGALMFWMVGCDHEVGGMEEAHDGMVWSVSWHPLGHILASGSNDHATKFWTRNRPGDEMRDKYNLNTLPHGMMEQELLEYTQESTMPNLPGIGMEQGLPESEQIKEETADDNELPSIPGLDWEEDAALLKNEERMSLKKVPYARPVPRMFEQAWAGEIDVDQLKKEQLQQQQKAQFIGPSQPSLLLAQQVLGAAIAGTIRQQLAANEAARMILPRGQLMLGPGGPRMIISPGQTLLGPRAGQMLLFPGGPGSRNSGTSLQVQQQTAALTSAVNAAVSAALLSTQANAGRPHNGTMGPPQQGGPTSQTGHNQNQLPHLTSQGQMQPQGPNQGKMQHQGPNQGQMQPQGPNQGKMQPQGPNQGQMQHQGPNQGKMQPQGPNQGKMQHQGPNQGQMQPPGPIQGQMQPPGPNQGKMQPQGPNQGKMQPQGPNQGKMQLQGPNQGQMQPPGPNQGKMQPQGPNQGQMQPPGPNQGQMQQQGPNQGQMKPPGPKQGQIRPMNLQGQIRPQGQIGDSQGQVKPSLLGSSPNIQGPGQQTGSPRVPGPGLQFSGAGGAQVQFGAGNLHATRGPQDQDRDERFQGQNRNQTGGQTNTESDQDYRHRVYNGPAGRTNMEDQDFRQQGQASGQNVGSRQANMEDSRNRGSRDFNQSSGGEPMGHGDDLQGSKRGYDEEENYDEYGDVDERIVDERTVDIDVDQRVGGARDRGGRGGGFNARGEGAGWEGYGRRQGEDSGDYGEEYEEEFGEYDKQEDRNRGKKRQWGEGPGGHRWRGAWGQGDVRGKSRGPHRGRGRGHRGSGYGRGSAGDREDWGGRGGHRGGGGGRGRRGNY